ncbi:MAG: cation diffusion facilitator family transporter [Clostridia bacterium]|nr:cation diffusion facilitator family transporter [Clostridia bacterium]
MNFIFKRFIKDYTNTSDPGVRVAYGTLSGVVGIICNIALFVSKLLIGLMSGWISIVADAFNNITDAATSILSLIGFKISNAPPDKKHPFGHGRAEYVYGFVISIIILIVAYGLMSNSFNEILNPEEEHFSLISVVILLISVFFKLFMFLFNMKISKTIDSQTIKAVAMDCISDVFSSLSIIIGIFISYFFNVSIDAYIGILVSIFIVFTGISSMKETYNLLLGAPPSPELIKSIKSHVMSYDKVIGVHDLILHSYGHTLEMITLHLEIPCTVDVMKMHDIVSQIEYDLSEKFRCSAVIRIDPVVIDDNQRNHLRSQIMTIAKNINPRLELHNFKLIRGSSDNKISFELIVPLDDKLTNDEIKNKIVSEFKKLDDKHTVMITAKRGYS